jgi:hypothetical protein
MEYPELQGEIWTFVRQDHTWTWIRHDPDGYEIARARREFDTLEACKADAQRAGYKPDG